MVKKMSNKSKFEIGNLSTWGIVHRAFFALLLFALVCLAYYFFKGKEQQENVDGLQSSLQSSLTNYEKKAKDFAELKYIREEVELLKGVLKETVKNLPTNEEWPSLVNSVYESAKDNGITFEKYQPKSKIEEDYYLVQPVELGADAGYLSISSFVEKVTSLERIMNVESVTLKSKLKKVEKGDIDLQNLPLEVSGELRTYIFKDE